MVVEIAFVALLTGAVARALPGAGGQGGIGAVDVEVAQMEGEVAEGSLDDDKVRLIAEVREIARRMTALEAEIQALMRRT
jgi:hypothetical protein